MTTGDGRYIKKHKTNSYWLVRCPCHPHADGKGYIKEHRLVMEVHLGRFLERNEHIHFLDGNGLNSKLENLKLVSQEEHSKLHKYWRTSPRIGNTWAQKPYNVGTCKKEGCPKQAQAHGYCSNHNRDIWRKKRRGGVVADKINHPEHYKSGGMEAIDVIEAFGLGFHLGNAVKYILRAGRKTSDAKEDIKKAIWYLERFNASSEPSAVREFYERR